MKAEELKLEQLRQRIEDQDWKLMRGQLSVHEHDLASEFKDIDRDSDDSMHVTEVLGMIVHLQRNCDIAGMMKVSTSSPWINVSESIHHKSE